MSEARMPWKELTRFSSEHGLLAKQLYLVLSEPTNGLRPVLDNLEEHVSYQTQLELDGVMFAAGPVADDTEQEWLGDGVFAYRADSKAEAIAIAERDPMHASGARRFVVRSWLLNEGTFGVRLFYSAGKKIQIM